MGRWTRWAACLLLAAVVQGAWTQGQCVRDLLVCQSVSGKGQPVMADTWFGAGATSLTAWFRTLDLPPGTKAEVRWLLHGATLSTRTVALAANRFATDRLSLGLGETLPTGTYEVRVTVNGAPQASALVKVGSTRPVTPDQPVVAPTTKPGAAGTHPTGLVRSTRTPGGEAATAVAPPAPGPTPAAATAGTAGTTSAPVTAVAPEPPTAPRPPVRTTQTASTNPPPLAAPDVPPLPATPSEGPARALDVTPTAPEAVATAAPVAPTGAAAPTPVPVPVTMPVPTAPTPGERTTAPVAAGGVAAPGTVAAPAAPAGVAVAPIAETTSEPAPAGTPLGPRTGSTLGSTPMVGGTSVRPTPAGTETMLPTPPKVVVSGSSPLAGVRAEAPPTPLPTSTPLTGGGGRSAARVMTPTADHVAPEVVGAGGAGTAHSMPREAETGTGPTEAPLGAPPAPPVPTDVTPPAGATPVSPVTPPATGSGPPVPTMPVAPVTPGGEGATTPVATNTGEGAGGTAVAPAGAGTTETTPPLPGGPLVGTNPATPPPATVVLRGPLTGDVVAEDLLPVALPNDAVSLYLVNLVPVSEPAGLQPMWLLRMPDGRTWPPTMGAGFGLYAGETPAVSPASLLVYADHQDGIVPLYEVPRDEALLHAVRENQAAVLCAGRDIYDMRRTSWQRTAGAWRWTWLVRQVDVQAGDTLVACLTDVVRSRRAPEDFVPTSHEELFLLDEKGKRVTADAIGPEVAAQVATSLGAKAEGADMAALLGALSDQGVVGLSAWKAPSAGRYQVWAAMPFDKSRATAKVWTSGQ